MNLELINYVLIGIIIILAFLIMYVIIYLFVNKKNPSETLIELNKKLNEANSQELIYQNAKKTKKKKSKEKQEEADPYIKPGQDLLNFDRICNDMIIKEDNNNSIYSMVIQCRSINFDLMSEDEKFNIEQNFISFLNQITYPIQIHVQNRIIDFINNVTICKDRKKYFENKLKDLVEKFNQLHSNKNENQPQIKEIAKKILKYQKLYEYIRELEIQVERISKNNFILQSNYYIIVSCSSNELGINPRSKNPQNLNLAYAELSKRCNSIIESLRKCEIEATILNSYQLVELFYATFAQEDNENALRLREFMESGLLKLYL